MEDQSDFSKFPFAFELGINTRGSSVSLEIKAAWQGTQRNPDINHKLYGKRLPLKSNTSHSQVTSYSHLLFIYVLNHSLCLLIRKNHYVFNSLFNKWNNFMYLLNNNKVFRCIIIPRDCFYRAWYPLTYTSYFILYCYFTRILWEKDYYILNC